MTRGALLGCLGGLLLAGASGCNTYKYFEIHLSFDPMSLQSDQSSAISQCWITVSGADSAKFRLRPDKCPPKVNATAPLDVGTFEFSTFADSGSLTFKFDGYLGVGMESRCILATGTKMVPVSGLTTITDSLVAAAANPPPAQDCYSVTPPKTGDGGI
jgi:hypothetical protein